jgi:hypothetical protein
MTGEFEDGRNLGREDREGDCQYLRAEVERLKAENLELAIHVDGCVRVAAEALKEKEQLQLALKIALGHDNGTEVGYEEACREIERLRTEKPERDFKQEWLETVGKQYGLGSKGRKE